MGILEKFRVKRSVTSIQKKLQAAYDAGVVKEFNTPYMLGFDNIQEALQQQYIRSLLTMYSVEECAELYTALHQKYLITLSDHVEFSVKKLEHEAQRASHSGILREALYSSRLIEVKQLIRKYSTETFLQTAYQHIVYTLQNDSEIPRDWLLAVLDAVFQETMTEAVRHVEKITEVSIKSYVDTSPDEIIQRSNVPILPIICENIS